ncbi:MAG: Gfo/Idh/MocA family oxidoreductase [Ardenticatenaceae bacterium]|nr:Gfo/Idh/MocA family oxidoreductase [Ardenticatenaceae bacterium]HBY92594.1 dehydrogenase [Chloroflexota bacterium]
MAEPVVGVVGTGFIGPVHVEALRRLGIRVKGVAGSSPERARLKAQTLRVERIYPDYQALIDDPEITVVHITSPNRYHYPQVTAALAAGKHVVCEKPLAMNAAESAEMLALARESGRLHAVNFNLRFYPLVHEARARVQRGDLGSVFIIQGSYLQDWLLYPTDWNWRLVPEESGPMRAVADIGSHWIDLTGWVAGQRVTGVMADFSTFIPIRQRPTTPIDTFTGKETQAAETVDESIQTEDYAAILLEYDGGARGVCSVSQVSAGRKNRISFEIDGSQESLAWNGERPNELWIGHRERANEVLIKDPALLSAYANQFADAPGGHTEGFLDTFKQLYKAIYRSLEAGDFRASADFPTFADGHESMLIGEAILKSARERGWVAVER